VRMAHSQRMRSTAVFLPWWTISFRTTCLPRRAWRVDSKPGCLAKTNRALFPSLDLCLVGRAGAARIRRAGGPRLSQEVVAASRARSSWRVRSMTTPCSWNHRLAPIALRCDPEPAAIASKPRSLLKILTPYANDKRVATIKADGDRPLMLLQAAAGIPLGSVEHLRNPSLPDRRRCWPKRPHRASVFTAGKNDVREHLAHDVLGPRACRASAAGRIACWNSAIVAPTDRYHH